MTSLATGKRHLYCRGGFRLKKGLKRRALAAGLLLVISFLTPVFIGPVHAEERKRSAPITQESYFFVDHATLFEPYDSLNPKLPALELSRLLDERMRFPTMHFLLEGGKRVIGMRVLAEGKEPKNWHSTWAEAVSYTHLTLPTRDLG